jgi:hypothetical protein
VVYSPLCNVAFYLYQSVKIEIKLPSAIDGSLKANEIPVLDWFSFIDKDDSEHPESQISLFATMLYSSLNPYPILAIDLQFQLIPLYKLITGKLKV